MSRRRRRQNTTVTNDIWGWFNSGQRKVYDLFASLANDGDTILEIGALFGKSTCYLAKKLQALGKKVTITVVDPWELSTLTASPEAHTLFREKMCVNGVTPLSLFQRNIRNTGVESMIQPMQCTSDEGFEQFKQQGKTFRFVMIDGNHTYEQVKKDIVNALAICTQANGIVAGDDYFGGGGVAQAVQEVLHDRFELCGYGKNCQNWLVRT